MRRLRIWILLMLTAGVPESGFAGTPAARYSPTERLRSERLAAAQASMQAVAAARRTLPPAWPDVTDFRCIFHAHAGDSAHTGGQFPEMAADARAAGVNAVFLSDHFRPPRDFMDSFRGLTNGVLFIPGSEARGFLAHPPTSVMSKMDLPAAELVPVLTAGQGLAFLSHIEERPDHPMDGLTGLEIYNRHYDAKRDLVGLLQLAMKLTDPRQVAELTESLRNHPDEMLAAQCRYPEAYLEKWDAETAGRRLVGVAANDCHHNQILVVKVKDENTVLVGTIVDRDDQMREVSATVRPSVRRLTQGRKPGDFAVWLDFDPYFRSFRNVTTHVFAPELTEAALRAAVKAGRVYVSHDWMGDPTGFRFAAGELRMGDEARWKAPVELTARFPVKCRIRLLRGGEEVATAQAEELTFSAGQPGVYRVEAWLEIGGEERPWIYSNPIYLR